MSNRVAATLPFFVIALGAAPIARAQSCAAADSVLGPTNAKSQLKTSYDKFADTTALESKAQPYAFLGQEENIWISFAAKHAGQASGPLTPSLHLRGSHNINARVGTAQTPDRFPDSTVAIVLADSSRMTLRGGSHRAQRNEYNIIGPPTLDEDLWFPISTVQLAELARAKNGGIRIGEFDMPMQKKISESAAAVYRTVACATN